MERPCDSLQDDQGFWSWQGRCPSNTGKAPCHAPTQCKRSRVPEYTWTHCTRAIVTLLGVHTPTWAHALLCSTSQLHCWRQSHLQAVPRTPMQPPVLCPSSQPTPDRHCCHSVCPLCPWLSCQPCAQHRQGDRSPAHAVTAPGLPGSPGQVYLCPCSVSCHCHEAPEPHRFQ